VTEVRLNGVEKAYGDVKVLHDIKLDIQNREFVVFVGPSGCGKSTLLRMIAGLEEITDGEVVIKGRDVTDLDPSERGIAMVFQSYALYPHMSVRDNLAFGLRMAHTDAAETGERVAAASAILKIDHLLDRRPGQLSGGQRQRVAIARALVIDPSFVVADEPTSMLDVSIRISIMDLMLNLGSELGVSYLYITHDLAVARYMCDRIAVMYLGKIVEIADSEELLSNPLHPYTKALLSAVPIPDPSVKRAPVEIKGGIGKAINPPPTCRFLERCPMATEICHQLDHPPLEDKGNGHYVACHLVDVGAA
jgi:lactose/L-arabinose transport system ATP-binding protein